MFRFTGFEEIVRSKSKIHGVVQIIVVPRAVRVKVAMGGHMKRAEIAFFITPAPNPSCRSCSCQKLIFHLRK